MYDVNFDDPIGDLIDLNLSPDANDSFLDLSSNLSDVLLFSLDSKGFPVALQSAILPIYDYVPVPVVDSAM